MDRAIITSTFCLLISGLLLCLNACTPVAIGSAGATGYQTAKDKRSIGTMIDDSVISNTVKARLFKDEFIKSRHIDVDVLNGVVFLIGVAESASQRRMAADIARGVDGVRRVENQLMVGKTSAGQIMDDMILSSRIKTELIKAKGVSSTNIDVDVNNNVVTLTGILSSESQKNKVLYIVNQVAPGRQVVDNLSFSNQ